jgi:hypothetical protein
MGALPIAVASVRADLDVPHRMSLDIPEDERSRYEYERQSEAHERMGK